MTGLRAEAGRCGFAGLGGGIGLVNNTLMRPHQLSTGPRGTILRFERATGNVPAVIPGIVPVTAPALNFKALVLVALALRIVAHSVLAPGAGLAEMLAPVIGGEAAHLLFAPLVWTAPAILQPAWVEVGFGVALASMVVGMALLRTLAIGAGASYRTQRILVGVYALWPASIIGCGMVAPEAVLTPLAIAILYLLQRVLAPCGRT